MRTDSDTRRHPRSDAATSVGDIGQANTFGKLIPFPGPHIERRERRQKGGQNSGQASPVQHPPPVPRTYQTVNTPRFVRPSALSSPSRMITGNATPRQLPRPRPLTLVPINGVGDGAIAVTSDRLGTSQRRGLPDVRRHGNFTTMLVLLGYLVMVGAIIERLALALSWGRSLLLVGVLHMLVAIALFVRPRSAFPLRRPRRPQRESPPQSHN